ncbi:MAG: endonuclease/exonuclease/phosphatase family protein [Cyclobacteriaceae bacterium]
MFTCSISKLSAQDAAPVARQGAQIVFWNVENLFDTQDDSLTNDDEYVPYSMRAWKRDRYQKKLHHLYKTIVGLGGWELPEIICLAEVENRKVLEDLLSETPLLRHAYQIVHQDSPDRRGIDLAVLYRSKEVKLLDTAFIALNFPGEAWRKSRDILYLKVQPEGMDTVHLFVNHWPSRYGGAQASAANRMYAARLVHQKVSALFEQDPEAHVVVTGDFNDEPADESLKTLAPDDHFLKNISQQDFLGTHKHQGKWSHFDHMWVSASLLDSKGEASTIVQNGRAFIFHPEWLLEKDKSFGGVKPYRTYAGFRYLGGFSDHLPIFLELIYVGDKTAQIRK